MRTVSQVSSLTGVSVRTLHHYDAVGLLRPTRVTEAGYRLYDEAALERLHSILLYRELEFSLEEIRKLLDEPGFDPMEALDSQIRLLEEKKERLEAVLSQAKQMREKGSFGMKKEHFDKYSQEAKARWGETAAWKEYEEKSEGRTRDRERELGEGLMEIFARMGKLRHQDPASPEAQALVRELQRYITEHYYTCTPQILRGLGQMYAAGGEFTENIDKAGGEGTALFARDAIEAYVN